MRRDETICKEILTRRGGLIKGLEKLDDDVTVPYEMFRLQCKRLTLELTNNGTTVVKLLGSGKVALLSVYKVASHQVVNSHGDGELSIGSNVVSVLGVGELGRRHPVGRRDGTDRNRVTRPTPDLKGHQVWVKDDRSKRHTCSPFVIGRLAFSGLTQTGRMSTRDVTSHRRLTVDKVVSRRQRWDLT